MFARLLLVAVAVVVSGAQPAAAQESTSLVVNGGQVGGGKLAVTVSLVPAPGDRRPVEQLSPSGATVAEEDGEARPAVVERLAGDALEVVVIAQLRPGGPDASTLAQAFEATVDALPPDAQVSVVTAGATARVVAEPTAAASIVTPAFEDLSRSSDSTLFEAVALAMDRFSAAPDRRRALIAFAGGYQGDPTTRAAELAPRVEAAAVDIYVVGAEQGVEGSAEVPFPLPLQFGRRVVAGTADLPAASAALATGLANQYRLTTPSSATEGPFAATVRVGVGDSVLENVSIVGGEAARPSGRSAGGGIPVGGIATALGLFALVAAAVVVPPRVRARLGARRRVASPPSVPGPLDDGPAADVAAAGPPPSAPIPPTAAVRPTGLGGERVEGRDAVRELISSGRRTVRAIWMLDELDDPVTVALAEVARIPVHRLAADEFEAEVASGAADGVLATASPLRPEDLEDLARGGGPPATLLVIHGRAEADVVAEGCRSVDGLGLTGVVLTRSHTAPITAAATAAARGTVERVRFALVGNVAVSIPRLRRLGFAVVGIDPSSELELGSLGDDVASAPIALVVGADGPLERRVRQQCDLVARVEHGAAGAIAATDNLRLACQQVADARRAGERSRERSAPPG